MMLWTRILLHHHHHRSLRRCRNLRCLHFWTCVRVCVLVVSDTVSVTFENTTYVTIWETQIVLPPLSPPLRPQTPRTIRSTPKYHEHRLPCTCLWDVSDPCPCLRYPWRWNEPDCNDWVWRDPHFSGRSLEISLCSSSTPWLEICVCVCVEERVKIESWKNLRKRILERERSRDWNAFDMTYAARLTSGAPCKNDCVIIYFFWWKS